MRLFQIQFFKERMRRGETNKQLFLGDIYALQGKYAEAAKVYKKSGYTSYAMNMYTDLRMFDLAKVGIQHQVTSVIFLHNNNNISD